VADRIESAPHRPGRALGAPYIRQPGGVRHWGWSEAGRSRGGRAGGRGGVCRVGWWAGWADVGKATGKVGEVGWGRGNIGGVGV
jgi:hypothetical protein